MAAATRVSIDEYLRTDYEPECELIDGNLIPKPMGTREHMRMEKVLLRLLAKWEQSGLGEAIQELSFRFGEDVRVPDFVFVRTGARFERGILLDPPLLCVEILSLSQRPSELFAKCETYHSWGVPYCWVIDPIGRVAWEYHKDSPVRMLGPTEELRAGEIAVALDDLFANA